MVVPSLTSGGAKCIGQYGGYETFLDQLTEVHSTDSSIQYYIVTKANGDGAMDEGKLSGVSFVKKDKTGAVRSFKYHNANVVKLNVPQIGPAQAIAYDIMSFRRCLGYNAKKSESFSMVEGTEEKAPFSMTVAGKVFDDRKDAGSAIIDICKEMKTADVQVPIGEYMGMKMTASFDPFFRKFNVTLKGQLSHALPDGIQGFVLAISDDDRILRPWYREYILWYRHMSTSIYSLIISLN